MSGFSYTPYVAKQVITAAVATTTAPGNSGYLGPTFIEAAGYRYWTVFVTGITTATVSFWGSIDQQTYMSLSPAQRPKGLVTVGTAIWVALPLSTSSEGGTSGATTTVNGVFTWHMPLLDFGANVSAWTSGTINVYALVVS
jgi:hypothetical protein